MEDKPKLDKDTAYALALKRGLIKPEKAFPQNKQEQAPKEELGSFAKYLWPAGIGAAEGASSSLASVANLIPMVFGSNFRIPEPNFSSALPEGASNLAYSGGKLAGEIAAPLGAFGKASKLIPKAAGKLGLAQTAAEGALSGAATNEFGYGGREGGAALGAVAAPLMASTNKAIANKLISKSNKLEEQFGKKYEALFKKASKEGIDEIKVKTPDINVPGMEKRLSKDELKALEAFKNNPTIMNAHKAQSKMKEIQRGIQPKGKNKFVMGPDAKTRDEAALAEKKLLGFMQQKFSKSDPALSSEYAGLTRKYAEDVAPYLNEKLKIEQVKAGANPKEIVEALRDYKQVFRKVKNPETGKIELKMQKDVAKDFPELKINKMMEALTLENAAKAGGLGALGYGAYNFPKNIAKEIGD